MRRDPQKVPGTLEVLWASVVHSPAAVRPWLAFVLVLVSAVLGTSAAPLARGTLLPAPALEFWKQTGVGSEWIGRFISEENCRHSSEMERACRNAFIEAERLLSNGKEVKKVVAATGPFSQDEISAALRDVTSEAGDQAPYVFGKMTNALLKTFDPHAAILPKRQFDSYMNTGDEETMGFGFDQILTAAGPMVLRVYAGTPAERAGLKVGDRLLNVNGESLAWKVGSLAAVELMGRSSTRQVSLKVERQGRALNLEMAAGRLKTPNVLLKRRRFGSKNYVTIQVRRFEKGTCEQAVQALSSTAMRFRVDGVILDLRSNPGGLVDEARCVASLFQGQDSFVKIEAVNDLVPAELGLPSGASVDENYVLRSGPAVFKAATPIVVLVNAMTASASEMLAAALQDHRKAWIVGEKTSGKGTMQAVDDLTVTGGSLKYLHTVKRFFRPSGAALQFEGVTPDFEKMLLPDSTVAERTYPREKEIFGDSAISKMKVPPRWRQTRSRKIRALDNCVRRSHVESWYADWLAREEHIIDQQTAFAYGLLQCD